MVRSLNINQSSGPDGISARMLKATPNEIPPSITAMQTMRSFILHTLQLPYLSERRLFLKLCTVFKTFHGLCYFPPHAISVRETRTYCIDADSTLC